MVKKKEEAKSSELVYLEISSLNVLTISIIIAALIISATIFMVGGSLVQEISNMPVVNAVKSGTVDVVKKDDTAHVVSKKVEPTKTVKLSDFLKSPAAKIGSDDAPVILVEFSDYQCSFCKRWFNDSKAKLFSEYVDTGKVQFVYYDFPLTSIHPGAMPAAIATRCAGVQGKYWEMYDALYAWQNAQGKGTVAFGVTEMQTIAAGIKGIDTEAFNTCLTSNKFNSAIQANLQLGTENGIKGTPGFLIGKRNEKPTLISGAQPYSVFKSAIDSLLA